MTCAILQNWSLRLTSLNFHRANFECTNLRSNSTETTPSTQSTTPIMSKNLRNSEMVNIDRKVVDRFYRHKMPTLCTRIQKGNTILCNIEAIAQSLGCEKEYPIKFFGFELGIRVQLKPKSKTSKQKEVDVTIPGHHDICRLNELLHKFIDKFVLCSCCRLPECNVDVQRLSKKNFTVTMRCRACGFANVLPPSLHKLVCFIGEHPPKLTTCPMTTSTNKTIHVGRASPPIAKNESSTNCVEESEEGVLEKDAEDAVNHPNDDDVVDGEKTDWSWSCDTSENAVASRLQHLSPGIRPLLADPRPDSQIRQSERVSIFESFLVRAPPLSLSIELVQTEARRMGIKTCDVFDTVLKALVHSGWKNPITTTTRQYQSRCAEILKSLGKQPCCELRFERLGQHTSLTIMEQVFESQSSRMHKHVGRVCYILYDLNIVEEHVFLEWGEGISNPEIHDDTKKIAHLEFLLHARDFLNWLGTADSDTDDASDDDDDDDNAGEVNEDHDVDDVDDDEFVLVSKLPLSS